MSSLLYPQTKPLPLPTGVARAFHLVVTTPPDIAWITGWERPQVHALVDGLLDAGTIQSALVPELEAEVLVPKPLPTRRAASRKTKGKR